MKILIVGGGTAGLITSIILKKHLDINVDLVYSKNIGIIGVGEGSTEHFSEFMKFVGIDNHSIIKECDATYKTGIMFENWNNRSYFHNVGGTFTNKVAQYHHIYAKLVSDGNYRLTNQHYWNNRIDKWFLNRNDSPPANQYHFNTYKLNEFLLKIARSMGINAIDDEILQVNFKDDGEIDTLQGSKNLYDYDFYIDATGFKRLLIGQMGAKWRSFSRYLKMKSAITFQTADEDNYNLWTLSRAMDYGWLFRIPVWGRYGNGYIFDSDYITADQAKIEAERYFGKNLDIGKQFNFDPGMLDRVWIKNCCAVGISGSFVEPLEATSIGTTIQQSFLLMHRLINYNEKVIEQYNKSFTDILENIRDFIVLHYITRKNNTNFWVDAAGIELPDSLNNNLETWRSKLPIREDFNQMSDYIMFYEANFILVLEGLDLFDRSAIKKEYENHPQWIKDEADEIVKNRYNLEDTADTLPHKVFIGLIRDYC
jgi:hypothetical protein